MTRAMPLADVATAATRPARPVATTPINILIVDDEPKNLTVLETVLDDPGYRLVRAESADQALLALVARGIRAAHPRHPHARHDRLRAGADDQGAQEDRARADHLPDRLLQRRPARARGLRHRRGRLPAQAGEPAVLRSKVAVFAELHRKSRALRAGQPRAARRSDRAPPRRGAAARAERDAGAARAERTDALQASEASCARPTAARTSSWRRSPTSCATRWRRCATPCSCCSLKGPATPGAAVGARA